jgi:hypothetical protein
MDAKTFSTTCRGRSKMERQMIQSRLLSALVMMTPLHFDLTQVLNSVERTHV